MTAVRWAVTLGVLQVLDLGSTWLALNAGAKESNPVVLALGWAPTAALKGALVLFILAAAARNAKGASTVLQFVCVLYAAIVALNLVAAHQASVA